MSSTAAGPTSFAKWCKEVTRIPRHFHHLIHLDTKRTQQRRMLPFLLYIFFMFNVNVTLYEYIIIFIRSFLRQVFPMILPFMYHEVLHCYNFPCVCDPFSAVCRKISHYSQVCYEKIFQQWIDTLDRGDHFPSCCKFNTTPFQVQCCLLCKEKEMLCGKLKGSSLCVKKCLHPLYLVFQKKAKKHVMWSAIEFLCKIKVARIATATTDLCFSNGLLLNGNDI